MIYLDSAATSLYKPRRVGESMLRALHTCAGPGRGGHRPAMEAAEIVYSCREAAAELFHVPSPEQVVFTANATHSLNLAIRSLVRPGDRVVISGYEHNAVVRPLHAIGANMDIVTAPLFQPDLLLAKMESRIPGAAAVICTHVSNVFGYVLPMEKIAAKSREHGVPLIVDASQSAGVMDIDFEKLGAEFLAAPGHKGLMGPQGTGILLCKAGGEPLLYGGTGSQSSLPTMPPEIPDRMEAGTHNVCGIAGLREGIRYILARSPQTLRRKEDELLMRLIDELKQMEQYRVFASPDEHLQCGVLSVIHNDMDSEIMAEKLARQGIAVRAGLHCAPLAHRTAGTEQTGTVRFSVSPFNSIRQMEKAVEVLRKI